MFPWRKLVSKKKAFDPINEDVSKWMKLTKQVQFVEAFQRNVEVLLVREKIETSVIQITS